MPSGESNPSTASSTSDTNQENSASTTVNGDSDSSNRQIEDSTPNGTSGNSQQTNPIYVTSISQQATASEAEDLGLEAFSETRASR